MLREMLAWKVHREKTRVGKIGPDRLEEFSRCLRIVSGMIMNITSLSARFIKSGQGSGEWFVGNEKGGGAICPRVSARTSVAATVDFVAAAGDFVGCAVCGLRRGR
jgi:hypothetical protein